MEIFNSPADSKDLELELAAFIDVGNHSHAMRNNAALDIVGTMQTSTNPEIRSSQVNTIIMPAS